MAEILYNDLLSQLSGQEQDQFQGVLGSKGWLGNYQNNPTANMVTGHENYAKFKPIADAAAQSKTLNKGFFNNLFSMGSADAAMPTDAERAAINNTGIMGAYGPNMRDISGEVGEYGNTSGFDLSNMDNPDAAIGPIINFKDAPIEANEIAKGLYMNNPRYGPIDMWKNQGGDKTTGFNLPNFGLTGILKALGGTRPPQKQAAYDAIMGSRDDKGWGTYKGNQYNIQDGKIYSELNPYGKNFDSLAGSESVEEMDQNKIDWALGRLAKFKDKKGLGISQRLYDVLQRRNLLGDGVDQPPKGPSGYTGPKTYDFDPGAFQRSGGQRPDKPGGFTDPGKGSYGPHKAQGGYMRSRYNRGGRVGILAAF